MSNDPSRINAVLDHPHTPGLDFHQWTFLPGLHDEPVVVVRSNHGRRHKHAWRPWIVLICNHTECNGRALVRAEVLTEAADVLPLPEVAPGDLTF